MQSDHWFRRLSEAMRDHEGARLKTDLLPPRYEILGDPKAGGMGVVYRAWDRELGREVAIKVLLETPEGAAQSVARIRREAEFAARLTHPNIVAVHDVGIWKDSGKPYIVMQYIDGTSLDQAGIRDLREVARVLAKAARAVSSAHERGVVHRDLKPANILLDRKGYVYLTDFGLAQDSRSPADAGSDEVAGTPAFMAPEQATGVGIDAQSDVYALGATLYALVTGRPPARGTTAEELLADVVRGIPPPARKLRPDCPEALERIIHRAMAKRKEDRYRTAVELAEALESFRRMNLLRRHPWAFGAAALALGALLVALVQVRVEHQRASEVASLAEIQTLIDRNDFQGAARNLEALRPVLGSQDERIRSREEELRSRLNAALDRESMFLFRYLWADDRNAGLAIQDRMKRLDPSEGAARIRQVDSAVEPLRTLAGQAANQLGEREYLKVTKTIQEISGSPFGAYVLRSIQARLKKDLETQIGLPPAGPGKDTPPIPGIRDALALLNQLDPGNPRVDPHLEALDLQSLYVKAQKPGLDSESIFGLLTTMKNRNRKSPYTSAVELLYNECRKKEDQRLTLEVRRTGWNDQGLKCFDSRSRTSLVELRQQIEAEKATSGDPASETLLDEISGALAWLDQYERIWETAQSKPEEASLETETFDTNRLRGPWKNIGRQLLENLRNRVRTGRTLAWSRQLADAAACGDLENARKAVQRLDQIGSPDLDAAKRTLSVLEAGLKDLKECRRLLEEKKSIEALHRILLVGEAMPGNHAIQDVIVACFDQLATREDTDAFFEEHHQLVVRGTLDDPDLRERTTRILETLAPSLSEPARAWRAALEAVEHSLLADSSRWESMLEKAILKRRLGKYDDAHDELVRILEGSQDRTKAFFLRGQIRFLQHKEGDALEDFEHVGNTDQNNLKACFWLAMSLNRLKKPAPKGLWDLVGKGVPGPDVQYELALSRFVGKDFEPALEFVNEAKLLGFELSEEGRIARAAECLSRQEASRRFERDVRFLEAEIRFKQKDYRGCVDACKAVLNIERDHAHSFLLKAEAEFELGSYTAGKDDAIQAEVLFHNAGDEAIAKRAHALSDECLKRRGR